MIVVEGPDGAGKTTLIEALQERFDLPVAPRVVTKDTIAMVDLRQWVDHNLDEGFQHTIFDRHRLISEPIYGPVLRVEQEPGFNQLSWMAPRIRRFYDLEPIIIYCLPPLDVVRANVTDDPDNTYVAEFIEPIYSAYVTRAAIDKCYSPGMTLVWDYKNSPTIKNEPAFFGHIQKELEDRR